MKNLRKNIGIATISSFLAIVSSETIAQGKGTVELEMIYQDPYTKSLKNNSSEMLISDSELAKNENRHLEGKINAKEVFPPQISLGFFITDNLSLNFRHGVMNRSAHYSRKEQRFEDIPLGKCTNANLAFPIIRNEAGHIVTRTYEDSNLRMDGCSNITSDTYGDPDYYGRQNDKYTTTGGYMDEDTGRLETIKGTSTSLTAQWHFGDASDKIRPYVSHGISIHSGQRFYPAENDKSTYMLFGAGVKWYFKEHFFTRLGLDATYRLEDRTLQYIPSLGIGINLGGGNGTKQVIDSGLPNALPLIKKTTEVTDSNSFNPVPLIKGDNRKEIPSLSRKSLEEFASAEEMKKSNIKKTFNLDIKFDFDKTIIKTEFNKVIKEAATFMKKYDEVILLLTGHTDSIGTKNYNEHLSKERSQAVRSVLIKNGIDKSRISAVGFGSSKPIASNATEEGRAANRRTEATVTIRGN